MGMMSSRSASGPTTTLLPSPEPPRKKASPWLSLLLPGEVFDAVIEPLPLLQPQDKDPPQPPFAVLHDALLEKQ